MRITDGNGDYVKLMESDGCKGEGFGGDGAQPTSSASGIWWSLWWWAKAVLLLTFLGVLAAVFLKWVCPFFVDKEVIPIINWETRTFSKPVLAILLFFSVALFPTLLLPSTPSMWVAGMTFGYGFGFLIIIAGVAIGVSLPYFIGYLFHEKIQRWLKKYPNKASIIRLASEGADIILRGYVCKCRAVLGKVGMTWNILVCKVSCLSYRTFIWSNSMFMLDSYIFIFSTCGILIQTLAEASHDQHSLSAPQIIFNVAGFCATAITTLLGRLVRLAMTYAVNDEDDGVVPELKMRMADGNGNYVKFRESDGCEGEGFDGGAAQPNSSASGIWWSLWWWARAVLLLTFLGVLAAVFLKWVGPFFMDKEVIPIINWETRTFSKPVLAILLFLSVALFPTVLLPSTPSMWVVGMTFGYGFGFLLIIAGAAVGVSLPYFVSYLFHQKIQRWLKKYPNKASIIRLAGEGGWFNQFRAVALIRISPFPYIIYNYCAVATHVKYGPYLLGSLVGMVLEIFVAIYTGILIQTLADASHDQHSLSAPQIIFTVAGFCATVITTVMITVYAKRRLKELQKEEEPLLL
ncbi:hypothetical protein F0562_012978 [Nyssa sinensis]|uniref:VTT domain-containing protein n=1 Tax=Nyssa sinensis TaxID=561372 RepID=A0A5J4ZU66_9ASTE|nr:hypothetical protein F0562_012978 [Nyssa sinensis]